MAFVFSPTQQEQEGKEIHVCFSTLQNQYVRKSAGDEVTPSWDACVFSSDNAKFSPQEYAWLDGYLGRENGSNTGHVTWKFDASESGLRLGRMDTRLVSQAYNQSVITWTIVADEEIFSGERILQPQSFDLKGATSVVITATMEKAPHDGDKHGYSTQLFTQKTAYDNADPFDVKITLLGEGDEYEEYVDDDQVAAGNSEAYVFTPTDEEKSSGTMHIAYNTVTNEYIRKSMEDQKTPNWYSCTFSSDNYKFRQIFLSEFNWFTPIDEGNEADMTWKVDTAGSGMKIKTLELKAVSDHAKWHIDSDGNNEIVSSSLLKDFKTFELNGATTVTISGKSEKEFTKLLDQQWKNKEDCPLEVKLTLVQDDADAESGSDATSFVFVPSPLELESKSIHVCYNSAKDEYTRKSNEDEVSSTWSSLVHSSSKLFRYEDHLNGFPTQALVREESEENGAVTWMFDVSETDFRFGRLMLKAVSLIRTGSGFAHIMWSIKGDGIDLYENAETVQTFRTFDLKGSSKLSLTAHLKGGSGDDQWKLAQLFRISSDDLESFPFEVKLSFDYSHKFENVDGGLHGGTSYIFVPNKDEKESLLMHVGYHAGSDRYIRKCSSMDLVSPSWKSCTFNKENILLKEEYDNFFIRDNADQQSSINWEFDTSSTNLKMSQLELKALCKSYDPATIQWKIWAGDEEFTESADSLKEFKTFELNGSTELTLKVIMEGGEASQTRLFKQEKRNEDFTDFPLEIKVTMVKDESAEDSSEEENKKGFVFVPTYGEKDSGSMHIVYHTTKDCYIRKSSEDELTPSWKSCLNTCVNMEQRKQGDQGQVVALARLKGSDKGQMSWKFDAGEMEVKFNQLQLKAVSSLRSDVVVNWTVCAGDSCNNESGSIDELKTFDLGESTSVTVTASVEGGGDYEPWEAAQIFEGYSYQDDDMFPFEMILSLA